MKRVQNKSVWLVGASSGIGAALAAKLAQEGNFVYVSARNATALDTLASEYPGQIVSLPADISDEKSLCALREALLAKTDCLDYFLYCAGYCEYDDGPDLDMDMYYTTFEANFFGALRCLKIALPLLRREGGCAALVSSLAATVPFPRAEAYGASKAALEYFLDVLQMDLKGSGVDVIKIQPGFVDTPMTAQNDFPMPWLISADEAAERILQGLARRRRVIDFPWQLSTLLKSFAHVKPLWSAIAVRRFRRAHI